MKILLEKFKESLFSLLPIIVIVAILACTPIVNFSITEIIVFIVCSIFLVIGMGLFNLGAEAAMRPMGEYVGAGLTKTKKIGLLVLICFLMGLLITISEPDLSVLASQVKELMSSTALILSVGIGVGLFLVVSVLKIVFHRDLAGLLLFFYLVLFALGAMIEESGKGLLLPLAFDSGGVTTGPITVPFIMALGVGVASTIGGKHSNDNSFGLIALCSIGPMIAVMILLLVSNGTMDYHISSYAIEDKIGSHLFGLILEQMWDVLKSLGLIILFFLLLNFLIFKLPKKRIAEISFGLLFTYVGLVIFLSAVSIGYLPIGYKIGTCLSTQESWLILIITFIIGMATVLGEPAVYVLNNQVEEITGGSVSKKSMMISLSIGVGIAICLSVVRILFNFSILYYLIPGYLISLGLSFFVPRIYTSIAFDSGGVASGPLTSSFVLPLAIGLCYALQGEAQITSLGFGVVSMVALTPLITIQVLGFKAIASSILREKRAMKRILDADDEQIIYFN